jgi:hypothetical protein
MQVSGKDLKEPFWNEDTVRTLTKASSPEKIEVVLTALKVFSIQSEDLAVQEIGLDPWSKLLQRIHKMELKQRREISAHVIEVITDEIASQSFATRSSQQIKPPSKDSKGENPPFSLTSMPDRVVVDFTKSLSPRTRSTLAQTNRQYRDLVRIGRVEQWQGFLNEPTIQALFPYFCRNIPDIGHPETLDAWQNELLEEVVPNLLNAIQDSSILTDAEKKAHGLLSSQEISSDQSLLLRLFQVSYAMSLVASVWEIIGDVLPQFPSLKEKVCAARAWLHENQHRLSEITCMGRKEMMMTCLPKEICELTLLERLHLPNNALRTLPKEIGAALHLTSVSLNSNQFKTIPECFCSLPLLHTLYLENNRLRILPENFGSLLNLEHLFLSRNQLKTLPETVIFLLKLKWLDITDNRITDLPNGLAALTCLRELQISRNPICFNPRAIPQRPGLHVVHEV